MFLLLDLHARRFHGSDEAVKIFTPVKRGVNHLLQLITLKWNPIEDWKIFHNTHEPIIEQATFDTVQRLVGTPRRIDTTGEPNPLTGLMFCADCGAKMYNSCTATGYCETNVGGKIHRQKIADHYKCSTHSLGRKTHTENCSAHYIRTEVVREVVLDAIRQICGYVRGHEAEFVQAMIEDTLVKRAEGAKSHKKQLAQNERRIAELDTLFRKTYEDFAVGRLNEKRFEQLSGTYEQEQADLKTQNTRMQAELAAFLSDEEKVDGFLKLVRKYTRFEELTTPMLNEFISKIYIHKADKSSGERIQVVDVYFNFIGRFDVPMALALPTPEEQKHEEQQSRKRAKQREYNQTCYAKKKSKREQADQEQQERKSA
jgi:hypothetical protein